MPRVETDYLAGAGGLWKAERAATFVPARVQRNAPLIVHVIYRLTIGGLENGVVTLANRIPPERYRQTIVCLAGYDDFRQRIQRSDVEVISVDKREGHDLSMYLRLWKVIRRLDPDIVHTRTFGVLDSQICSLGSGRRRRVHSEHGRESSRLFEQNPRRELMRRLLSPLVHHFITVSKDLSSRLAKSEGVSADQVTQIYNGVDTDRFCPSRDYRPVIGSPDGFFPKDAFVIGTVGRMQPVKDQITLVKAFLELLRAVPEARNRGRLVLVGDGPLREEALRLLHSHDASTLAWLPGERADIPELLRRLDLFVLPSREEGVSNTILEAMATALPVVAMRVGGNPELVDSEHTGLLVPPHSGHHMAEAIARYFRNPAMVADHGQRGRDRAMREFSLTAMIDKYLCVYDRVLRARTS